MQLFSYKPFVNVYLLHAFTIYAQNFYLQVDWSSATKRNSFGIN